MHLNTSIYIHLHALSYVYVHSHVHTYMYTDINTYQKDRRTDRPRVEHTMRELETFLDSRDFGGELQTLKRNNT